MRVFFCVFQTKVKYEDVRHHCPQKNNPCALPFKEPYDEHDYIYHTPKTAALICGCGFGDIYAHKFINHVKMIHDVKLTPKEAAERHYWHNLPEFERTSVCHNKRYDRCKFKTPLRHIMDLVHACCTDMQPSKYPKYDEFYAWLPRRDRPTFGYPPADRDGPRWQTQHDERRRSSSRPRRGSRKRTRSRQRTDRSDRSLHPEQEYDRRSRPQGYQKPRGFGNPGHASDRRGRDREPAAATGSDRPQKRAKRDPSTRKPESFSEEDRRAALRRERERQNLDLDLVTPPNQSIRQSTSTVDVHQDSYARMAVHFDHPDLSPEARHEVGRSLQRAASATPLHHRSPSQVCMLSEGECSQSDVDMEDVRRPVINTTVHSDIDHRLSYNMVQLVPDNYEGFDLKPVTSNELVANMHTSLEDEITRNLRKIRLQFQSNDSTDDLHVRASQLQLQEDLIPGSTDVEMEEPQETQVMPIHRIPQAGQGWQPTPAIQASIQAAGHRPPTSAIATTKPQTLDLVTTTAKPRSSPITVTTAVSTTTSSTEMITTTSTTTITSTTVAPTAGTGAIPKTSQPTPQFTSTDVRITSGEYIQLPGGQMKKNPDWKPPPPPPPPKPEKKPQGKPSGKPRVMSEFGETSVQIDTKLLELLEIPPLRSRVSMYSSYEQDTACNMKGYAEYGDIRVSEHVKNNNRKMRFFAKYALSPGTYAVVGIAGKPTAYATITCHPRYYGKEQYNPVYSQYNPSQYPAVVETLDVRPGNLAMARNVVAFSLVPQPGEFRLVKLPVFQYDHCVPVMIREPKKIFGELKSIKYKHQPAE